MKEKNNNGKGIFYGVIGVATLIVAIIGATFAYFTASQTGGENVITGNAATISFGLEVNKVTHVDETQGGLIPMTNGMLDAAVTATTPCQDDTGAAVCQIYSITVTNTGSAGLFLDGYVNLTGGAPEGATQATTNMRWAEVFSTDGSTFTLTGTPALANGASGITPFTGIAVSGTSQTELDSAIGKGSYTFNNNPYEYINKNYMRTSGHTAESAYTRTDDATSALVFNQYLAPSTGAGASETYKTRTLYFVVWLSETGTNQNLTDELKNSFFGGIVTFLSAQGGEVSATFNGYTRVEPTDNGTA